MLALSTSWITNINNSGKQIVDEIKNLGFDCIELGFSLTQKDVSQIYANQGLRVLSLHNYCPIPNSLPKGKALPDCYSLSSSDTEERKKAIKFTKRTIITAKKFKAKAVVLHAGRVEIEDCTKQLIKIKVAKKAPCCEFESLKEFAIRKRKEEKAKFLDAIFLSLRELSDFAYNLGVALGIENRIYIREIPNYEEIKIFLDNFNKRGVYYWHDTGHAYILEKLGFARHRDYLNAYKEYLLGIHLHDVKDFTDHKAPFSGEIDFSMLKPYLKKSTIKVIETHKPATREEVISSKKRLEELLDSPD